MIKSFKIGNKPLTLSATGGTLCIYKQQFGTEYYNDLKDESNLNTLKTGFQIVWSMAKTADPAIPDPDAWLSSFKSFPLVELLPDALSLLGKSFGEIKKDKSSDEASKPLTSENLVACCLSCGLSMDDIQKMSIGFLLDTISAYIDIKTGKTAKEEASKPKVRKATQIDFDLF